MAKLIAVRSMAKVASVAQGAAKPMMPPATPDLPPLLKIHTDPRPLVARVALLFGAALFFALGIVGWLIPVVTGIPFYIVAFAMLGAASRRTARWLNRAETHLPYRWRVGLRRLTERARKHRRQSSPRARSDEIVRDSTASKGSGDQSSSARALEASKLK